MQRGSRHQAIGEKKEPRASGVFCWTTPKLHWDSSRLSNEQKGCVAPGNGYLLVAFAQGSQIQAKAQRNREELDVRHTNLQHTVNNVISLPNNGVLRLDPSSDFQLAVGQTIQATQVEKNFPPKFSPTDQKSQPNREEKFNPHDYDQHDLRKRLDQNIVTKCIHCGRNADDEDAIGNFICKDRRDTNRC